MKPINVSVRVERRPEDVYAFLDVLANHEQFTDHMLVDWTLSGLEAGIGAKARMRANLPGPKDWLDMEVVDARAPETIVEESVGANGARRTRGTYTLDALPGGGTMVNFELAYLTGPAADRLMTSLMRMWLKRANAKAMRRLGKALADSAPLMGAPPASRAA